MCNCGSPTGTLWAKIDLTHDNERRDGCRGHHPAPLCVLSKNRRSLESHRRYESKHNAEGGPHLPHHREGAADVLWRRLSSIDGCCARLGADGESESETSNEEVWPVVRSGHPDAGDS